MDRALDDATIKAQYLAGQLPGTRDWLMLELVLHWHAGSVQATFRCDAHSRLVPLSNEFVKILAGLLRTTFAPSSLKCFVY